MKLNNRQDYNYSLTCNSLMIKDYRRHHWGFGRLFCYQCGRKKKEGDWFMYSQGRQELHEVRHCEKCQRLGYNCKSPSPGRAVRDEDAESLSSEASTTSSTSVEGKDTGDANATPPQSDDEDEVEMLKDKCYTNETACNIL